MSGIARYVINENQSLDPMLDVDNNRIIGIFVRNRIDHIAVDPDPGAIASLEFLSEYSQLPMSVEAILPDSSHSGFVFSSAVSMTSTNERQHFIFPKIDHSDNPRLIWTIESFRPESETICRFSNSSPQILLPDRLKSDRTTHDLIAQGPIELSLAPLDGFLFEAKGQNNLFRILLRLVRADQPSVEVRISWTAGDIDFSIRSKKGASASFFLSPYADATRLLFAGSPTASTKLSNTMLVVGEPFTPRFMQSIASSNTFSKTFPLSKRMELSKPQAEFLIVTFSHDDHAFLYSINERMTRVYNDTIRCVIFFGSTSSTLINVWLRAKNVITIGLVATHVSKANKILGKLKIFQKRTDGTIYVKKTKNVTIFVLVMNPISLSLPILDEFLSHIGQATIAMSAEMKVLRSKQLDERLPALPHCLDLEVGAIVQLANTQRGRITNDKGTNNLDYTPLKASKHWICERAVDVDDRDELKIELQLRQISEYWAVFAYDDIVRSEQNTERNSTVEISSDRLETLSSYLETWLKRSPLTADEFAAATAALNCIMPKPSEDEFLARDIACYLLDAARAKTENAKPSRGHAWVNPLSIILLPGPNDYSHSEHLELSLMNIVSFTSCLSGSKPASVSCNLRPEVSFTEPMRRQGRLRESVGELGPDRELLRLLNIQAMRMRLGELVEGMVSKGTFRLLNGLGADRVVTFSSVQFDFIKFRSSILCLELPMARYPIYENFIDGFIGPITSVAATSLRDGIKRVGILKTEDPSDLGSEWALEASITVENLTPILGAEFTVAHNGAGIEGVRELVTTSSIIFFLGHSSVLSHGALRVGESFISFESLEKMDWSGKLVILLGCETSTSDRATHDLASKILRRGATAVVGTSTQIGIAVANAFLTALLLRISEGWPIDYAFFMSKRIAVVFETLAAEGMSDEDALELANKSMLAGGPEHDFSKVLSHAGLTWDRAYLQSVYSLSLSLVGGAGARFG